MFNSILIIKSKVFLSRLNLLSFNSSYIEREKKNFIFSCSEALAQKFYNHLMIRFFIALIKNSNNNNNKTNSRYF
jgi:hypothetical protein